jgi:ornithine cyclodeaminase
MSQKILCLSEEVVQKCLVMADCLQVNKQAFIDLYQKKVVVPTRIGIPYSQQDAPREGAQDFTLFKPAAVPDQNILAMKLVAIRQHNPSKYGLPLVPATIISVDPPTGQVNGLVAATYLTGARTATGSALTTALYQPNLQRLVIFGAGLQARLHIHAISTALQRPIPHVTLVNRTVARAEALAREIQESTDWVSDIEALPLQPDNPQQLSDVLGQADAIVTATNTTTPLFASNTKLKTNCHICSVGSYTPDMQEIPTGIVDQCTVIYDTPEALAVGDLKHLHGSQNAVPPQHLYMLGQILSNQNNELSSSSSAPSSVKTPPRQDGKSYTFFKSVGTAVQDVCTANMVLQKARELQLGVEIEL